jgi:hypothetical protein
METLRDLYHTVEPYLGVGIAFAAFVCVSIREGYKRGILGREEDNNRVRESGLENLGEQKLKAARD